MYPVWFFRDDLSVVFGAHDIVTQAEGNPTRFFIDELIIVSTVEPLLYERCFGQLPLFCDHKMYMLLANPWFPRWRPKGLRRNLIIFFPEYCMKMKIIGPRGESIPGASLGSANAFMPNVSLKVFLTVCFQMDCSNLTCRKRSTRPSPLTCSNLLTWRSPSTERPPCFWIACF